MDSTYIHPITLQGKRIFDLTFSLLALLLLLPLWPLLALIIKLDSPGPIFFRQTRIGRVKNNQLVLFEMIKFRSMVVDAETKTGAVWAGKSDPRITRVGWLLRKTRLDELPQLINVIQGDMSLIGPRPERPDFYPKLEEAIPYFTERTYGLTPGITGLAQVNQGYDTCIDDVRSKVGFDHAYALALSTPKQWIKMDLYILFKTIMVMVLGRGQ